MRRFAMHGQIFRFLRCETFQYSESFLRFHSWRVSAGSETSVHRYDGKIDEHFVTVKPILVTEEFGSANPDGFFVVDLKDESRIKVHAQTGEALGHAAGVFRGEIVATTAIGLDDVPDARTSKYYLRPLRFTISGPRTDCATLRSTSSRPRRSPSSSRRADVSAMRWSM